jgi:hypothetical protein
MKTILSRTLMVLTVALCVVAAQAQTTTMLKGDVPFSFNIGDRSLPAGEYTVKSLDREIEAWYDTNGRGLFFVRTLPMGDVADASTTKLVFHRYGDQYYLAEVCNEGTGHELIPSRSQRQIAKGRKYETVAVLMTSRH